MVLEAVLPELIAYQSILVIRDILDTKTTERRKEMEKAEREGRKLPPE